MRGLGPLVAGAAVLVWLRIVGVVLMVLAGVVLGALGGAR